MSTGGVKVEYASSSAGGHLRDSVPALVVSSKVPTTVAATGGYQANDGTGATTGALSAPASSTPSGCAARGARRRPAPRTSGPFTPTSRTRSRCRRARSRRLHQALPMRCPDMVGVGLVAGSDWRSSGPAGRHLRDGPRRRRDEPTCRSTAILTAGRPTLHANVSLSAPWTGSTADATDRGRPFARPHAGLRRVAGSSTASAGVVIPGLFGGDVSSSLRTVPTIRSASSRSPIQGRCG